jgi:antitoxin (DNA-binding transcriptional repressor) of toxin-antitoxin stability system
MSSEMSVNQARDHFSQAVNLAAFSGQVTRITRGRNGTPAAAIVPVAWLEDYEDLLDTIHGPTAAQRLAEIRAGQADTISAADARAQLGIL